MDAVMDMAQEKRPTLIINCAAYTKVDQCEQETESSPKRSTGNGAGHPRRCAKGVRERTLVHFSTDFVFNGQSQAAL